MGRRSQRSCRGPTNASVKKTDASTKGTNMLSIVVAPGQDAIPRQRHRSRFAADVGVDASGIAGLRINHNLNVHVDGFGVK